MKLLNDEQVSRFIVDGFVRVQPEVKPSVHAEVDRLLRVAEEQEYHYGNNIISRVPVIWEVLRSPSVAGALTSLLGPNYYVHPHRAIHTSRPVEDKSAVYDEDFNGPPMGKGSRAGSGWHQDAQSPLSRARHHLPKYLIGFYFPHSTPPEMGPTRFQAGSYLYSHPVEPSGVVLPKDIEAGAFYLLHFDTVHAGWPNRTDASRYMVKFVFARTTIPEQPYWNAEDREWHKPNDALAEYDAPDAWKFIWNWMHGNGVTENGKPHTGSSISFDDLNGNNQQQRLQATYGLAKTDNVSKFIDRLRHLQGSNAHERRLHVNSEGKPIPRDDTRDNGRRWNERAIVMDDAAYALTAVGSDAVDPLCSLLESQDPWVLINAAFALGELGFGASKALPNLSKLLAHPAQQVVRQALDAIGSIARGIDCTLPAIDELLTSTREAWEQPEVMRGWTGVDQIRMNAVSALLNAINYPQNDLEAIERMFVKSLKDRNGYVGAIACEGLTRLNTPSSMKTAMQFLSDRRFDESVTLRKPF
ncbi:MAG: HEAT repeat domain-containing protein [Gammaproteobacteria bacterium]|nr:HEAT repeat domain-containing protein [Gammaproteobacteria bacterium]